MTNDGQPEKTTKKFREKSKERIEGEECYKKLVEMGYDTFHRKFSDGYVVSFVYAPNPIDNNRDVVVAYFVICSKNEKRFVKAISYKLLYDVMKNDTEDTKRCITLVVDKINRKRDMRYVRDAVFLAFKAIATVGKSSIPRQLTHSIRWMSKFDLC